MNSTEAFAILDALVRRPELSEHDRAEGVRAIEELRRRMYALEKDQQAASYERAEERERRYGPDI